jgi:hypothetical protein
LFVSAFGFAAVARERAGANLHRQRHVARRDVHEIELRSSIVFRQHANRNIAARELVSGRQHEIVAARTEGHGERGRVASSRVGLCVGDRLFDSDTSPGFVRAPGAPA